MRKSEAQTKSNERFSYGALMFTLVTTNLLAFVYLAPYA